jgi:hypothetical protein
VEQQMKNKNGEEQHLRQYISANYLNLAQTLQIRAEIIINQWVVNI